MKTTIDLADDIAAKLKKQTVKEGISMRVAVNEALRDWLRERPSTSVQNSISRDIGVVSGEGLTPEADSMGWDQIRSMSYDQRV